MLKILKSNLFFFLLLAIIIFTLYGKSINYGYTNHDDNSLIQDKVFLLSDIKNIPKLFTTSCFYSNDFQYYRPILTLSFAIETIIFGENITIYHLTNILLFLLSLWLMYIFLCKLKLNENILKLTILLISVHPILTSCAVWIPARNDTLLFIFLISSFIFFIKYLTENKNIFFIFSFIFFTLALFTKEITLVSVFIYIYFLFYFNIKLTKKQILINIATFILITSLFFYLKNISTTGFNFKHYITNYKDYMFNIVIWTIIYIKQILIPTNTPIMLYKPVFNSNFFALSIIFFIVPIYLSFKNILNKKIIFLGIIWFIIFLIPTYFLYDYLLLFHRIFVPILGFIIILCEFADKILNKFITTKYLIYLFICLITILFYLSNIQADKYMNEKNYWYNAYNNSPNYHVACLFKAYIEFENNNLKKSEELINEAMNYNSKLYFSKLAILLFEQKKYKEAEELFLSSIKNNIDVAVSYKYLSKISLINNDLKKTKEYALSAYKTNPYNKSINELMKQFS